ncbi:MAG: ABC transporter permease subunit [Phycisphaeraceae bacterium]
MSRLKSILAIIRSRLGLPLLAKELIEQANRKRTYVLRTVYAVLLFFFSTLFLYNIFESYQRYGGSPFAILGSGREMFLVLVSFQFTGLYLFLPAMVCGVITYEKERQSLPLLMITDLRPWEIIIQKLAGRLIPMVTFLLLSLPLMAVAYSFGGVTSNRVSITILLLALSLLQVGGMAIMCSAYARSTAAAFLMTFVLLLALYLGPALLALLLMRERDIDPYVVFSMCPLFHLGEGIDFNRGFNDILVRTIPVMVTIPVLLLLARVFLTTRANVPPRNSWLAFFGFIDRMIDKFKGGTGEHRPQKEQTTLPAYDPIAWRETAKKGLGKPRYLMYMLVLFEVPVVLLVLGIIGSRNRGYYGRNSEELFALLGFLWPLTALFFCVAAANLFVTERARQTLDLLLTTPLTSSQILWQKMAGLRRLMWVMLVPFATIYFAQVWVATRPVSDDMNWGRKAQTGVYLVSSFLTYLIYIPMISWLAVLVSMRTKSQTRAIMTSVGVLVGWCLVPAILIVLLDELFRWRIMRQGPIPMLIASPMSIVPYTEFNDLDDRGTNPWASVIVNSLWYGGILVVMRVACYYNADRWLGRVKGEDFDSQTFVAVERSAEALGEMAGKRAGNADIALDPSVPLTHNGDGGEVALDWVDAPPSPRLETPPLLPPGKDPPQ